jgi:tRNA (mo5U34)-methyltransferase
MIEPAEEVNRKFNITMNRLQKLGWYHSLALPNGEVIEGVQTVEHLQWRIGQFPLPADLAGKRVLDVGAWDGWFTFETERRGASVVAIDIARGTNFLKARELTNSQAAHHILDVLDLSPANLGMFDIVLCFGVLYHLRHPLLALERLYAMSTDLVLIESFVSEADSPGSPPRMEFYEGTELCGQFDNWVGPNVNCLLAWCRATGFAEVTLESVVGNRAHVTCRKKWSRVFPPSPATTAYIAVVQNAVTNDHHFESTKDDYVSLWFESSATPLTPDDVFIFVGDLGVRPVCVEFSGGAWVANFKVPLGLDPGRYRVYLRLSDGATSNAVWIQVNEPPFTPELQTDSEFTIVAVLDGTTWQEGTLRLVQGCSLAVWVHGLNRTAVSREMFELQLSGTSLPCIYASAVDQNGRVQLNCLVPQGLPFGNAVVQARFLNRFSNPIGLTLTSG